jgi:hypothetical protein
MRVGPSRRCIYGLTSDKGMAYRMVTPCGIIPQHQMHSIYSLPLPRREEERGALHHHHHQEPTPAAYDYGAVAARYSAPC